MAGRLARHPLVMDVTAAAAVAAGTGLIDAFGSRCSGRKQPSASGTAARISPRVTARSNTVR